jgi:Glycosyltransferase sugar-binding region containing DXD motif
MIPKTLHYVFGMASDAGGKPWSLVHYACLKSALERIRPKDVYFYCEYEPKGPWWELTRKFVNLEKIKAPCEIFGNPLIHPAHRADVVRLEKLISRGGIYLDADVFVHRSFDDLLCNATVLGKQVLDGAEFGLCNAVILSEAQAPFLKRWFSEYRSFRSRGRDEFWDEHSVQVPLKLSKDFPREVTSLSHLAFYWPTFRPEDIKLIFDSSAQIDISKAFATHLWESVAWERYLEYLTPGRVRSIDSNFHGWVRPFVASLPYSLGAPNVPDRLILAVRTLRNQLRAVTPQWAIRLKQQITKSRVS